jgi:sugar lactone lactonase YvrE
MGHTNLLYCKSWKGHWRDFLGGSSLFLLALILAGLVVAGCSRIHPVAQPQPATQVVWPAPPEVARIAFVKSVSRPADLGVKNSAFKRFGHWITGSQKGNEPLLKPFAVALDENDNLCLTDTGANAICYYDRAKQSWHRWDRIGKIRLASPVAIAKHGGAFFVADSALGSILAFNDSGKMSWQTTNHLVRPSGVAIVKDRLFVADSGRHCIAVFELNGSYLSEFGRRGTGPGEFNYPTHLAADQQGNLLVTDSMNGRVEILDANGKYLGEMGKIGDSPGQFGRPKGVAVDASGRVYAVDAVYDNLQIFDQSGHLLLNFGETGSGPGQFWLPNGVAISRSNEVFVTDSYNHRVQIFKYIGPP